MATASVATPNAEVGSTHGICFSRDELLTIGLDKHSREFPPGVGHVAALNGMIHGLARAAKSVMFHAENDDGNSSYRMQPVENIVDAIILLSSLSDAIHGELDSHNTRASQPSE